MPRSFCIFLGSFIIFIPSYNISPSVGRNKVEIIDIVVDFPAPLGPKSPNISPFSTLKDRLSTAFISLKPFDMFLTSNKLILLPPST